MTLRHGIARSREPAHLGEQLRLGARRRRVHHRDVVARARRPDVRRAAAAAAAAAAADLGEHVLHVWRRWRART